MGWDAWGARPSPSWATLGVRGTLLEAQKAAGGVKGALI